MDADSVDGSDKLSNKLNESYARDDGNRGAEQALLRDVLADTDQRITLLRELLGADLCRRLGIYNAPKGFVLSVVIPVFNESATVQRIISRVRETELPVEFILVDDGSTDGTRGILAALSGDSDCHVILHAENRGKGAALKTGLAAATGDVIVIQDADMEYDPHDFRWLLQPILENEADVIYGSRFTNTDCPVSPLWHRAANQIITFFACLASGYKFTDVETCYKMFRRELIQDIIPTLREKRFGIEIELTFKLLRQPNVRFHERPIRYQRRSYDEGKKIGWRDGIAAIWCIFRHWLFKYGKPVSSSDHFSSPDNDPHA